MNETSTENQPVKLRSKPPYTCRFEIAGKPCAAILAEDDSKVCKPHAQAIVTFTGTNKSEAAAQLGVPVIKLSVEPKPHWPFWP